MIALTKALDPADLDDPAMLKQLVIVDKHFDLEHVQRRWEYALALVALDRRLKADEMDPSCLSVADVGGFGSPFYQMIEAFGYENCIVIDPRRASVSQNSCSVEELAAVSNHQMFDCVISISTFEHTTTPLAFLDACHRILKPGGLLFLTFDYAEDDGPDEYHFHWMRERIITPAIRDAMIAGLTQIAGMELFGEVDLTCPGPQVYDYTFASLCLRKADPDAPRTN